MLPPSLKYIGHNGAGYDNIDIAACTEKGMNETMPPPEPPVLTLPGIAVSSTPVAVNNATADVAIFLMIGALRQAYVPLSSLRAGECLPFLS